MSKVEFEEFQQPYQEIDNTPKMVRWVIDYSGGLVKNEEQAYYVLVGFVVLVVVVSGFLVFGDKGNKPVTDFVILPEESIGLPQGL